jgi:hypothetical protein
MRRVAIQSLGAGADMAWVWIQLGRHWTYEKMKNSPDRLRKISLWRDFFKAQTRCFQRHIHLINFPEARITDGRLLCGHF